MAEHLARSARQRRVAILAIALGAGAIAFTYAGGDDRPDDSPRGIPAPSVTTDASVLGVVVTQPDTLPDAAPATPATVDDDDGPSATTTPATSATTDRPPASLVPPTVIENTTSTTEGGPPPTIDLSTTTTEDPTTSTTEVPPG
jgi:hypothetical protein